MEWLDWESYLSKLSNAGRRRDCLYWFINLSQIKTLVSDISCTSQNKLFWKVIKISRHPDIMSSLVFCMLNNSIQIHNINNICRKIDPGIPFYLAFSYLMLTISIKFQVNRILRKWKLPVHPASCCLKISQLLKQNVSSPSAFMIFNN